MFGSQENPNKRNEEYFVDENNAEEEEENMAMKISK